MASENATVPLTTESHSLPTATEQKAPIRSWRKKFRKMKMRFDRSMDESNQLYREEQTSTVLARRLQEQNDQLLDLLLELNDTHQIPYHLRFQLRSSSPSASAVPSLEADEAPKPLRALEMSTPHTKPSPASLDLHPELTVEQPLGYFDPAHEEEYLTSLDATLVEANGYNHSDGRPIRPYEHSVVTDKEISLKNPMSVTNWLRRNQPEVFLQDKYEERASAKAQRQQAAAESGAANAGGSSHRGKRASLASVQTPTAPRTEHEPMDEEMGYGADAPSGSGRGKRSRDDEPYRPKGGSSRPAKRKREDGEKGGRKKSRTSNLVHEDVGHDDA